MIDSTEVFVYIIETHFGTYYTGISNNVLRRWKEHVNGQSSYLSKFKPLELVYSVSCVNRSTAHRLEVRIKKIGALNYMNKLKYQTETKTYTTTLLKSIQHGSQHRSKGR